MTTYRESLRQAKEAVIAAVSALHATHARAVLSSEDEPRFAKLAEIANELRNMERDAAAVEAEHAPSKEGCD